MRVERAAATPATSPTVSPVLSREVATRERPKARGQRLNQRLKWLIKSPCAVLDRYLFDFVECCAKPTEMLSALCGVTVCEALPTQPGAPQPTQPHEYVTGCGVATTHQRGQRHVTFARGTHKTSAVLSTTSSQAVRTDVRATLRSSCNFVRLPPRARDQAAPLLPHRAA